MSTPVDLPPSDALRTQLCGHVREEMVRARRLFGAKPVQTADAFTAGMLENLASPDGPTARHAALTIIDDLVPRPSLETGEFWESPLGQAIAWVLGYHRPSVPQAHVHRILGVSRQRVHELINSGRLARINGHVQAQAVQELLRQRYAHMGE